MSVLRFTKDDMSGAIRLRANRRNGKGLMTWFYYPPLTERHRRALRRFAKSFL